MTTKDLQEGVRKRSIVLSFAVDGDFTFLHSLQAPALCCRMSPLQQT